MKANKKIELSKLFKESKMRSEFWTSRLHNEDETIKETLEEFEHIIKSNAPDDFNKFTGSYIQRLSNSNQLVLFYGNTKTRNPISAKLDIDEEMFDYVFELHTVYMYYFQKANKPKKKTLTLRSK